MSEAMKIGVVGTGHVGLITCVSLASVGHTVIGVDSDEEKIHRLGQGTPPFFEDGLEVALREQLDSGRLTFSTQASALAGAEAVFLCVGTPTSATGEAHLGAMEEATRQLAPHLDPGCVLIEKSTVPAGTTERIERTVVLERPDLRGQIEVTCNPEFLREGHALKDSLEPDRILVGAKSERAFKTLRRVYAPITAQGYRLIETDVTTAELSKHASNAFLALKISYANSLARLCEIIGADVSAVADVMGADPRIGRAFLNAGIGYGGYCLPKDISAFDAFATEVGHDFPLLREIAAINEQALKPTVRKVRDAVWNIEGKVITLLGLSFKPGTDDVRFSPALALAEELLDQGARVVAYDPKAMANAKSALPALELASDAYDAVQNAHCVVICTDWPEFAELDLDRLKEAMAHPLAVDGRNLWDIEAAVEAGFAVFPTGRPPRA